MKRILSLACVAATLAFAGSAHADRNGRVGGAVTGAVGGAVVGGPVGAVVGGVGGAVIGNKMTRHRHYRHHRRHHTAP